MHLVFMDFVQFSMETGIISPIDLCNGLVKCCVYFAVGTEFLHII
jgi:hypothetical protein